MHQHHLVHVTCTITITIICVVALWVMTECCWLEFRTTYCLHLQSRRELSWESSSL